MATNIAALIINNGLKGNTKRAEAGGTLTICVKTFRVPSAFRRDLVPGYYANNYFFFFAPLTLL